MGDVILDAGGLMLAPLGAPFAGEKPAGIDPHQDFSPTAPYLLLRDARSEARAAERAADHLFGEASQAAAAKAAESTAGEAWRRVRTLAVQILAEQGKDIEVAAWLTEAAVRDAGIAGLSAGAGLIADLIENFWDQGLYPLPDEDGLENRVAPVRGLSGESTDGTLLQPLRKAVLFELPDGEPITFWDYLQSESLERIADPKARKQRAEKGKIRPFEELERAARVSGRHASGPEHFAALRGELAAAFGAWARMDAAFQAKAAAAAPPTGRVRGQIEEMLRIAGRYAPPEIAPQAQVEIAAPAAPDHPGGTAPAAPAPTAPTREGMLAELASIAEYFRRTEPHSPLAYTLEEAVRRGRLTWPELLAEVVPDNSARSAILVTLGIRPPPPEGKS